MFLVGFAIHNLQQIYILKFCSKILGYPCNNMCLEPVKKREIKNDLFFPSKTIILLNFIFLNLNINLIKIIIFRKNLFSFLKKLRYR